MSAHSSNVYVFNINSLVNKQLFKRCTAQQKELQEIQANHMHVARAVIMKNPPSAMVERQITKLDNNKNNSAQCKGDSFKKLTWLRFSSRFVLATIISWVRIRKDSLTVSACLCRSLEVWCMVCSLSSR